MSPPSNPIKAPHSPAGIEAGPPISAEALATVTEILHNCAQVDAKNATFYGQFLAVITSEHSPLEIQNDETTADYQSEAKLIDKQLASTPVSGVVSACRTIVP